MTITEFPSQAKFAVVAAHENGNAHSATEQQSAEAAESALPEPGLSAIAPPEQIVDGLLRERPADVLAPNSQECGSTQSENLEAWQGGPEASQPDMSEISNPLPSPVGENDDGVAMNAEGESRNAAVTEASGAKKPASVTDAPDLFPAPTVVAGEDPARSEHTLTCLVAEFKPASLRERFLVDDVAHSQWKVGKVAEAERWIQNAAIAQSLLRKIVNRQVVEDVNAGRRNPARTEEAIEHTWVQGWWRSWEYTVFAAVSGDVEAIKKVESKLGPGAVVCNVFVDFDALSESEILLERVATSARATREASFRMLDKIAKKKKKAAAAARVKDVAGEEEPR